MTPDLDNQIAELEKKYKPGGITRYCGGPLCRDIITDIAQAMRAITHLRDENARLRVADYAFDVLLKKYTALKDAADAMRYKGWHNPHCIREQQETGSDSCICGRTEAIANYEAVTKEKP